MSDERKDCCGNCRFREPDLEECRRNPPSVNLSYTLVIGLRAMFAGSTDPAGETCGAIIGEWPKVFDDQWCGEWAPILDGLKAIG